MDAFFDAMKAAGAAGFAAVVLPVLLSCSQASVEAEQKWLTFHCPDGQVVMAQFQPQDQFVNIRFAGPRVKSASRHFRLRSALQ